MRISVIIPTYNEAMAIRRVLTDIPSDLVTEVIVVDSNSNDGTPETARQMGARVIQEPRRGYGRACLTGLANASEPDVVVFLDGDYSDRPSEMPILLAPIIEGRADITIGSRLGPKRAPRALPWHAAFGNRLAAGLITVLYGLKISDLGPFRAGRADVLRMLALEQATYGWAVEMILKSALEGFRVVEVPVSYHPRIGKSKISGTLKGTIGATWFILSLIVGYYFRTLAQGKRTSYGEIVPPPNTTAGVGLRNGSLKMKSTREPTIHLKNWKRTLVIMAKAPKPGTVKTRLNPSLPAPAVTALYRCLLQDTVALAQSLSDVEVAIMCPGADVDELVRLLGDTFQIVAQEGEGLAAGLISVFAHFAATGHHVIAFNSDSPHLPVYMLEGAFQALAAHDMVIGPTHDGGYYLVGCKAAHPTLFENDGLGTRSAFDRLLARARVLQLSTTLTAPFYDIDVAGDLVLLARELRLDPTRAPRTAAWFAEWGPAVAKLRPPTEEL